MTDQTTQPRGARLGVRPAWLDKGSEAARVHAERQAEWERKQCETAQREAEEREAKRAEERAEQARVRDAFNAARAREDARSPFNFGGPKNCGQDIRICLAKLFIDVWYDTLTNKERIDGLDGYVYGSQIDKQTLGALTVQLSNKWPRFKPAVGLLEKTVREKARATERNGFVDDLPPPALSEQDTGLNSWLILGLGAADSPLHRAASRAWMIDAARCAHHPGMMPNIVLAFDDCDPRHVATALSYDYPPIRDFLLNKMIDGGKGRCRATRRLPIRCGRVNLEQFQKKLLIARWREAAFHAAAGESVELDKQIADANDAFERATNPFVAVLEPLLSGVEGKIRVVDVVRAVGLDPDELDDNRDPRHGAINRAMDLLGFGHRRAVRWHGSVVKGWGRGDSTASLMVEEYDGGWRIVRS